MDGDVKMVVHDRDSDAQSTDNRLAVVGAESHGDLCFWIEEATKGLCDEAQRRIRAEIVNHYAEVLGGLRAAGAAEDNARQEALDGLGDPRAAHRGFRRTYLTAGEAGLLESLGSPGKIGFAITALLILVILVIGFRHSNEPLLLVVGIPILLMVLLWRLHLLPGLLQESGGRAALVLHALMAAAVYSQIGWRAVFAAEDDPSRLPWFGFVFGTFFLVAMAMLIAQHVTIALKLGRRAQRND